MVALIALVAGLTLAAAQKVREAGARTVCKNNLKQIGLGLHHYHDAHDRLPPGTSYDQGRDPYPFMNWEVRILPFLEREAEWRAALESFRQDKDFLNDPPHHLLRRAMPPFVCPSDPLARKPGPFAAYSDYLGVGGTDQLRHDGMLFLDSRVKFGDATDGLSSTLMVGERPPRQKGDFGWWYAGWGQSKDGSADSVLGVREINVGPPWGADCPTGPYHFSPGRQSDSCDAYHFWSLHPGGANFLTADGSVTFRSYTADSIMPALATRAGGEPVSEP